MIRSQFRSAALLPLIPAGFVIWILYELQNVILPLNHLSFVVYLSLGLFLFILVWVVFGELRTKALAITITGDRIRAKNFFGFGFAKEYQFSQLSGYKTSVLSTIGNSYEYLYLMVNNKKVIKISDFYHKNYPQLKQYITNKVAPLGYEKFNLLQEVKEIFM